MVNLKIMMRLAQLEVGPGGAYNSRLALAYTGRTANKSLISAMGATSKIRSGPTWANLYHIVINERCLFYKYIAMVGPGWGRSAQAPAARLSAQAPGGAR